MVVVDHGNSKQCEVCGQYAVRATKRSSVIMTSVCRVLSLGHDAKLAVRSEIRPFDFKNRILDTTNSLA